MKREWWLASAVTLLTLALALAIVRHFAPALLGLPIDLRLVQLDERQPAFFAGVFRMEDIQSTELTVNDPVTGVRGKPLFPNLVLTGPTDVLGFRNAHVPVVADIIAIGDSQTYGVNAPLSLNWPRQMEAALTARGVAASVYAMAVGGWGAPQYLHAGQLSGALRPRVMTVAFYAGNDPMESFVLSYGSEHWRQLRPDPALTASDAPTVEVPVPASKQWRVPLGDELATTMLVELRRTSTRRHPAVDAGWDIMKSVAAQLAELARNYDATLVVTLIPTKESAYAPMLEQRGIAAPAEFLELVSEESARREDFLRHLAALEGVRVVEVTQPLQQALQSGVAVYPADFDGHPNPAGYALIAQAFSTAIEGLLPRLPCGPVRFQTRDDRWHAAGTDGEGGYWLTASPAGADPDRASAVVDERLIESLRQLPAAPAPAETSTCR